MKISKKISTYDTLLDSVRIQISSFNNFLSNDKNIYHSLNNLFKIFFPIEIKIADEIRKIEYVGFSYDKPSKDIDFCIKNLSTYSINVKIKLRFTIGKVSFIKNIFLFSLPMITNDGFFIINGLKRVFLIQCIKNFGIHFNDSLKSLIKIYSIIGNKISFYVNNNIIFVKLQNINVNLFVFIISLGFFDDIHDFCNTFFEKYNSSKTYLGGFIIENNKIIKIDKGFKQYKNLYIYNDKNFLLFNTLINCNSFDKEEITTQFATFLIYSDNLLSYNRSVEIINNIFFNPLKYNLDISGRFFMNQQLGINVPFDVVHLTRKDIIGIINKILLIVIGEFKVLPFDHLKNKIFRKIDSLLFFKILKMFINYKSHITDFLFLIKDYLNINENIKVKNKKENNISKDNSKYVIKNKNKKEYYLKLVNNLFNFNRLNVFVMRFFSKNDLCQLLDDTNYVSMLSHISRQTFTGQLGLSKEFASFKVRDLKMASYSKIDPMQTPENVKIGLNFAPTMFSSIDDKGSIISPYYKVKKGKILKDKIYLLNLFDEDNKFLANYNTKIDSNDIIIDNMVLCRYNEEFIEVDKDKVDFIEYNSMQTISASSALIPFFSHTDGNRILLSTNHIRQVVPILGRQEPIVKTGLEKYIAGLFDSFLYAKQDGVVKYVDFNKIIIETNNNKLLSINLPSFAKNNKSILSQYLPKVKVGDFVKKGDLLVDSLSTQNGIISLGYNANIAVIPFHGANYEDSIIISDELRHNDIFTSYNIKIVNIDVLRTKYGDEKCSSDIFNISDYHKSKLDENGIIKIGEEVKNGDLLVAKLRPISKSRLIGLDSFLTSLSDDKKLNKQYEEILHYETTGITGRVVEVIKIPNTGNFSYDIKEKILIKIVKKQKLNRGDKLTGRYGNKAIVSKFLPKEDMPYTDKGERAHIILNPLGIISRMNLSQLLELHYTLLMSLGLVDNQDIIPFNHFDLTRKILRLIMDKNIEFGKVVMYDGVTGKKFHNKVVFGKMYFMKLEHIVDMKKHARSIGPYNKVTEQPTQGKTHGGGQRLSNLYIYTLLNYGVNNILRELYNFRSDDIFGRSEFYEYSVKNKNIIKKYRNSEINKLLKSYFNALGLDIYTKNNKDEK